MHLLDIILAVIGIVFIFIGLKRGLIGEIIRLAAMITGCFVAFLYYHDLALRNPLKNIPVQIQIKYALSFIVIYLLCAVAIIGIGWFIKKIVHLTPLAWIDHLAGALIGILKTLLITYVICLSISSLPARRIKNDFHRSVAYRTFSRLPKSLSLKSLLHQRENLRTIFRKQPPKRIDTLRDKIDRFKSEVDSAKEAHTSDNGEVL